MPPICDFKPDISTCCFIYFLCKRRKIVLKIFGSRILCIKVFLVIVSYATWIRFNVLSRTVYVFRCYYCSSVDKICLKRLFNDFTLSYALAKFETSDLILTFLFCMTFFGYLCSEYRSEVLC